MAGVKKKTHKFSGQEFTVTGLIKLHAEMHIPLQGKEVPCLLADIDINHVYLSPNNPRLGGKKSYLGVNFDLTKKGQNALMKCLLESDEFKKAADRLSKALEHNGGLNEPIWVVNQRNQEGNRRQASLMDQEAKFIRCYILPDNLSEEDIEYIQCQKHLGGHENWRSFIRSAMAWKFYTVRHWDAKKIAKIFQFDSDKHAMKYIHAYCWWKKSGLSPDDWSKFHHAYTPCLVGQFGYDPGRMEFFPDDQNIRKAVKGACEPEIVDANAGKKVDFNWFCQLIKNNNITDCRQSDGIVSPAVRHADKHYGPTVLSILQENVSKKKDALSPAEKAFTYFKNARQEDHLGTDVEHLLSKVEGIVGSVSKMKPYKRNNLKNEMLRSKVKSLMIVLRTFHNETDVDEEVEVG